MIPDAMHACSPRPQQAANTAGIHASGSQQIRTREQRVIDKENLRIQKKLSEVYRSRTLTTHGLHPELGRTIDVNDRWTMRNSIYQPASNASPSSLPSSRPGSAKPGCSGAPQACSPLESRQRPSSAPRASRVSPSAGSSVPKTLQVAACAGCGSRSFRKADGPRLFPCHQCARVFYCSETCAKADLQSHSNICKYYATGMWAPYGKRPEADYWVNNAAMAKARHDLKTRKSLNLNLSYEQELDEADRIAALARAERAKEKAAQAKQAQIEWRASMGLDGPRPCMMMNGKKI